jgi:hypothetical protein
LLGKGATDKNVRSPIIMGREQTMEAPSEWLLRQADAVERERVLPSGRGMVLVAMDDPVEPEQMIAQGAVTVLAGLRGRVKRVVPERGVVIGGTATVVEGLAGFGPPAVGPLFFLPPENAFPQIVPPGALVVVPGELTQDALNVALTSRAAGIFAASAQPQIIEALAGTECSALLDGSLPPTNPLPLSIVLAHGFGRRQLRPEILHVLNTQVNQAALLNPAQRSQNGQRAELVIPLPWQAPPRMSFDNAIIAGAAVWVSGGDFHGVAGRVARVLHSGQVMPSGVRVRAARVRLENGAEVTLPLANLQRVG